MRTGSVLLPARHGSEEMPGNGWSWDVLPRSEFFYLSLPGYAGDAVGFMEGTIN